MMNLSILVRRVFSPTVVGFSRRWFTHTLEPKSAISAVIATIKNRDGFTRPIGVFCARQFCSQHGEHSADPFALPPDVHDFKMQSTNAPHSSHGDTSPGPTWLCPMCNVTNESTALKCITCDSPPPRVQSWNCNNCNQVNVTSDYVCVSCEAPKTTDINQTTANTSTPTGTSGWVCPQCSHDNFRWRGLCQRCKTQTPRFKGYDWICPGCEAHNYAQINNCHRCQMTRSYDEPLEKTYASRDWNCVGCHYVNFRWRGACKKCNDPSPNLKPHDWICGRCQAHNYARTPNCFKCTKPKEITDKGSGAVEQDWICPKCSYTNAPANQNCVGCNPIDKMPGDWICPKCNLVNFQRRTTCFKCYTSKLLTTNSWACSKCGAHNISKNTVCFECSAKKSSESPSATS